MSKKGKWLRAFVVVCCLSFAAFAKNDKCHPKKDCVQVPEGGYAAVYLLGGWTHLRRSHVGQVQIGEAYARLSLIIHDEQLAATGISALSGAPVPKAAAPILSLIPH
jgi:hypothetical protein